MRRTMRWFSVLVVVTVTASPALGADDALVEAGRRIYEEGILPGGEPLVATRPEGLRLEGRFAACGTCHRPSGMGSIEGVTDQAILVPPLAGPVLFAPARYANSFLDDSHHYIPHETWRRAMTRPAYNEASLEVALRDGINTAGAPLEAPMPYYELDRNALAALSAYLRQLGSEPDPGNEADVLHVATVITPDVDPADAEAVLGVLRVWAGSAYSAGKPWRLQEWRLSGPAESWLQQLETLYEEQPVFAVLSGIGRAQWAPVQDFCEIRRVPCVLPSVDALPAAGGHYSMHYSAGVLLEARILARHLESKGSSPGRIVHLYSGPSGRVAAEEFDRRWQGSNRESLAVPYHVTVPAAAIRNLKPDDTLVLWLDEDEIVQFVANAPETIASDVYVSALLATPEDVELPPAWRGVTKFVTLFDDLGMQGEIARLRLERWLEQKGLNASANRRLQADAYAAAYLFNAAIAEMKREEVRRPAVPLTRAHLLEELEERLRKYDDGTQFIDTESHVAWYGRMSLGPGQRIAVRGGSIVRYESPDAKRLIRVSDRIVP